MASTPKPPRYWLQRALALSSWASIAFAVVVWLTFRYVGERWWAVTLLLYASRSPWVIPAALLVLVTMAFRRWRATALAGVGLLIIVFGVMGLRAPRWPAATRNAALLQVRVLTCNVHGNAARTADLARLIRDQSPDVVALQEFQGRTAPELFHTSSWHVLRDGELLIATRYPVRRLGRVVSPAVDNWGQLHAAVTQYQITTPHGNGFRFFNVHLESPHYAVSAALQRRPGGASAVQHNSDARMAQARQLADAVRLVEEAGGAPVILAGDFNTPCDSRVYRLNLWTLSDAFDQHGWGFGWTYFHRGAATRIDHILCNSGWSVRNCGVGPDVGSPHRPVIADLQRVSD